MIEVTELQAAGIAMHEMFLVLQEAGFSEQQALVLLAKLVRHDST